MKISNADPTEVRFRYWVRTPAAEVEYERQAAAIIAQAAAFVAAPHACRCQCPVYTDKHDDGCCCKERP